MKINSRSSKEQSPKHSKRNLTMKFVLVQWRVRREGDL